MKTRRSGLTAAIEREDWDAVALRLFLGVTKAARRVPPEALEQMIELLAETQAPGPRTRRGRR